MDEEVVQRVTAFIERMKEQVEIQQAILFGSRSRDDYGEESDVDLLIVSPDFEGKPSYKRAKVFYREWEYPPDIEVKCYTPAEFDRLRQRVSIASTAAEDGVVIA